MANRSFVASLPIHLKGTLAIAALALLYIVTARFGMLMASLPGGVTAVWPPTGIFIALVCRLGYRIWPGILLGALISSIYELQHIKPELAFPVTVAIALSFSLGNTLAPLLTTFGFNRYIQSEQIFDRTENIGKFVVIAVLGVVPASVLGSIVLGLTHLTSWADYSQIWWTWLLSDIVSTCIFAPPLLLWTQPRSAVSADSLQPSLSLWPRLIKQEIILRDIELLALIMMMILVCLAAFWQSYPLEYVLLPLLLWATFRFGQSTMLLFSFVVSVVAVSFTAKGMGPFIRSSPHESLLLLQSFISVISITVLVFSAALRERMAAQADLAKAYLSMESRVAERTAAIQSANEALLTEVNERRQAENALRESQHYIQQLNTNLERQVQDRTAQLRRSYDFIALLKRITDKIRDHLNQDQILQTAVKELALGLEVDCCNTALYDLDYGTSTICYEYTRSLPQSQGRVSQMARFPEIYGQLLEGEYFQFCSIVPSPVRGHVAMLACPIADDRGILGDLWLVNQKDYVFTEQDIRLVQQVANQCAIALRQARLYQEAQTQVIELERLNRLKDDFLSTVSHELRSPMSNIKMAIQMLGVVLRQEGILEASSHKASRYFRILQDECRREISLINDLLDLSRLDAGTEPLTLTNVDLHAWLPPAIEPFLERIQNQQQQLHLHMPDELPLLKTDESILERIFTELVHNACKYTPAHETIRVSVVATETAMELCISNSGVQIPEKEMNRIFDKFYRIPSNDPWKHGGTGLGLALVKKLVDHISADIQVKSGDRQTQFIVQLPLLPVSPMPAVTVPEIPLHPLES